MEKKSTLSSERAADALCACRSRQMRRSSLHAATVAYANGCGRRRLEGRGADAGARETRHGICGSEELETCGRSN